MGSPDIYSQLDRDVGKANCKSSRTFALYIFLPVLIFLCDWISAEGKSFLKTFSKTPRENKAILSTKLEEQALLPLLVSENAVGVQRVNARALMSRKVS